MTIKDLIEAIDGTLLNTDSSQTKTIETVYASDLMSDVLTLDNEPDVLITGLANNQSIRTAEMADINIVIIAKGKHVSEELVLLAKQREISLISSKKSVFISCGILYNLGLKGIE